MKSSTLTVRLDPELQKALDREAKAAGWSKAQAARYMLRRALERGMTPGEAGAREGFWSGLAEFREGVQEVLDRGVKRLKGK